MNTLERNKKPTYQGFNNITYIISAIFIIKMSIVSIVKNGLLMKFPLEDVSISEICAAFKILINLALMALLTFYGRDSSNFSILCVVILIKLYIGHVCYNELNHMYFCFSWCILSMLFLLKLISFIFYEDRKVKKSCSPLHFLYYLVIPTIIYKPTYIQSPNRNYKNVLILTIKFAITYMLLIFSMDQLTVPIMYNMKNITSIYGLVKNFLTLSVCVIITFVLFFYLLFCCVLEIFAILTLFNEKDFYGEWWNSKSVREFWALWNRMVYLWNKKHIYNPLLKIGVPSSYAALIVFIISGIIHEYVIAICSKIFRGWTFAGFIFQFVLMTTTDRLTRNHKFWGNIMFWCLFCVIGQPACIWLTYR